jgi:radical SAM protein with 4Fe4S-binding SPASM domain
MRAYKKKVQNIFSCDCSHESELGADEEFYFQWHITERCNLRCTHCYHDGYSGEKELPIEELKASADKMSIALEKWGKKGSFSFTGGEPFIRSDALFALASHLDTQPTTAYYDILTNGSLITDTITKDLTVLQKLRRVQMSIEGPTSELNDKIRGAGSFERTIKAIRLLKSRGLQVSIMTTVFRSNMSKIIELIDILENEGVDTFALERFIPEGAGSSMAAEALDPVEIRDVFTAVYEAGRNPRKIRVLMYRPLFAILDPDDPTIGAMCSIGTNALTVMHDGTILPCRRLPIPIGNIRNDSLFKIWYDNSLLWEIRNPLNLKGKCGSCDLVPICRGCRAVAYAHSGDYLGEDPQCWS